MPMSDMPSVQSDAPALPVSEQTIRVMRLSLSRICRKYPLGVVALLGLVLLGSLAVGAPLLAPYQPNEQTAVTLAGPSLEFWLGTDQLGRDLFTRVVYGARISLGVAFIAVGVGATGGLLIGLASGYYGGWVDDVVQRLVDAWMVIPTIVMALVLISTFGSSVTLTMVAIGLTITPRIARVVRASALSVRALPYVEAARSLGASDLRLILLHVLPSTIPPLVIVASAYLAHAVLLEATLSFLGLGVPPPTPSWGAMLSGSARTYMFSDPWLVVPPGVALGLLVLAFNLLGDAVRDVLDPTLRH